MSEQAVSDVALTARILGAAFYYPPSEIVQITELLSSRGVGGGMAVR